MVHRIYPAEHQLNKANASDTETAFLDSNLSIHNDTVSTKIYDQSRTNGPINTHLTIAQVMPRYNHNNEKQEVLL